MIGLGGARRPGLLPGGALTLHLASLPTGPDTSALRPYPSIAPSIILNANNQPVDANGFVRVRSRAGDIVAFQRGTGFGLPEIDPWVPVSHELRSRGIALILFNPAQSGIRAKLFYGDGTFDAFGEDGRLVGTGRDGQPVRTLAESGIKIVYDAEGYPIEVHAPTCRAVIAPNIFAPLSDPEDRTLTGFTVTIYPLDAAYRPVTNHLVKTIRVSRLTAPDSNSLGIYVSDPIGGETHKHTCRFVGAATWQITDAPGTTFERIRRKSYTRVDGGAGTDTITLTAPDGTLFHKTKNSYGNLGGYGVISSIKTFFATGEEDYLETRYIYPESLPASDPRQGRPSRIERPDGSWVAYERDAYGRVTSATSPFGDNAAGGRQVVTSHASLDPIDPATDPSTSGPARARASTTAWKSAGPTTSTRARAT
jgi:YD repeat-containing protein